MTIGRRPDLLRATLASLDALPKIPSLAINDFGDAPTNEALQDYAPDTLRVGPDHQLGHHRAIDTLYASVQTPFIFHNEDDWQFSRHDFLTEGLALLAADPKITSVCFRDVADMPFTDAERGQIRQESQAGIRYNRVDHLHEQWYGFTFNPHLTRKALWEELGGYAKFPKERHISRHLKAQGHYVAYISPGACTHIGDGQSAFHTPPGPLKRLKNWLRQR